MISVASPKAITAGNSRRAADVLLLKRLTANSPAAAQMFGSAIAMTADGKLMIVGVPKAAGGGAVEVYRWSQGQWAFVTSLVSEETSTNLGTLVAISPDGDYIAASDPARTVGGVTNAGVVEVFHRVDGSWSSIRIHRVEAPVANENIGGVYAGRSSGLQISADGNLVVVRANPAVTQKGHAYAWFKVSVDEWAEKKFVRNEAGTQFARNLSLSADSGTLVLGFGVGTFDGKTGAGAAITYRRSEGLWDEGSILLDEPTAASGYFGVNVQVSGDGKRLAVYAEKLSGVVTIFSLGDDGEWVRGDVLELEHSTTATFHGRVMQWSHDGEFLLVGATGNSVGGKATGSVALYQLVSGHYQLAAEVSDPDGLGGDEFGISLGMSADGSMLAVGARNFDIPHSDAGAVYLYRNTLVHSNSDGNTRTVPGVYTIESNQPLLAIPTGVTAIPLFIGVFRDKFGTLLSNESCIEIANFSDFRRRFGPSQSTTVTMTGDVASVEQSADLGSLALQLYFDNGGGRCYILPLHDQTSPTELAAMVGKIRRCPEITLYVVTERLDSETANYHPACDALDPLLRNVGDGFLIADSYDGEHRPATTDQRTAVYYPALQTAYSPRAADEDIDVVGFESENDERVTLAQVKAQDQDLYETISEALDKYYVDEKSVVRLLASAAVAGVYCRTDATLGIWHAPAGPSLNNVRALYPRPKLAVVDKLIDHRINRLYDVPGEGVRVWGARTQEAPQLPLWLHINVSRLFDAAARDIKRALQVAVFMPNNAITWNTVRNAINAYLYQLWRDGGLRGATSDEAYYVQIGNETMTAEDLLEGRLIVHVGLAALRPVEFIEVVFSQVLNAA